MIDMTVVISDLFANYHYRQTLCHKLCQNIITNNIDTITSTDMLFLALFNQDNYWYTDLPSKITTVLLFRLSWLLQIDPLCETGLKSVNSNKELHRLDNAIRNAINNKYNHIQNSDNSFDTEECWYINKYLFSKDVPIEDAKELLIHEMNLITYVNKYSSIEEASQKYNKYFDYSVIESLLPTFYEFGIETEGFNTIPTESIQFGNFVKNLFENNYIMNTNIKSINPNIDPSVITRCAWDDTFLVYESLYGDLNPVAIDKIKEFRKYNNFTTNIKYYDGKTQKSLMNAIEKSLVYEFYVDNMDISSNMSDIDKINMFYNDYYNSEGNINFKPIEEFAEEATTKEPTQAKAKINKSSKTINKAANKIYKGYRSFSDNKSRIDSQVNKMLNSIKGKIENGEKEAIINGTEWSPMKILKFALTSAAIFSFTKIGGICALIYRLATHKKRTTREKLKIIAELNTEIEILEEKISDARGDNNRQAKYALMRTKSEVEKTRDKIKYGINVDTGALQRTTNFIKNKVVK